MVEWTKLPQCLLYASGALESIVGLVKTSDPVCSQIQRFTLYFSCGFIICENTYESLILEHSSSVASVDFLE